MKKAIKLLIGFAIVFYVLHSKLVDFSALRGVVFSPIPLAIGLTFQLMLVVLLSYRWYLLCRAQSLSFSPKRAFEITWVSSFLSIVLPGSVGTDLVKGYYAISDSPGQKAKAALTIFMDRVVGSSMLFLVAAVSLLIFRADIAHQPQITLIASAVWTVTSLLVVGAIAFLFLAHAREGRPSHLETLIRALSEWTSPLSLRKSPGVLGRLVGSLRSACLKLLEAVLLYRKELGTFCGAAVLSICLVFITCWMYQIQGGILGIGVPASLYFYLVPVSILVSYFSFLPLGIGLGQVVFYQLFVWLGIPHPEMGATLCTLVQMQNLMFNLTGAIGFMGFRSKSTKHQGGSGTGPLRQAG